MLLQAAVADLSPGKVHLIKSSNSAPRQALHGYCVDIITCEVWDRSWCFLGFPCIMGLAVPDCCRLGTEGGKLPLPQGNSHHYR